MGGLITRGGIGLGLNDEVKGRIPTEASEAREGTFQRGVRLNSAIGQGNVNVTVSPGAPEVSFVVTLAASVKATVRRASSAGNPKASLR